MKRLVLAVLLASRVAAAEEPLSDVVERAARSDRPLIIELTAQWCGPCKTFEREVLPRPDVRRALQGVELVRYDVDQPIGESISDQFHAVGVPTFIVLDAHGKELARHVGLGSSSAGVPAGWFIELISQARAGRASTAVLEQQVIVHPDNPAARLRLAHQYRALGRIDDARAQLEAVVALPDRTAAAEAVDALNEIDLANARVQAALDKALDFVTRFPDSPRTSRAIVLLAVSKRVPRLALNKLVEKHLQTVSNEHLVDAVRVAILTGNVTLARQQLLERSSRASRDALALMNAEIDLYAADRRSSARSVASACADSADEFECYLLEESVAIKSRLTAATTRLGRDATHQLDALDHLQMASDEYPGMERLVDVEPTFRNAVAKALRSAERECADSAYGAAVAIAELHFGARKERTRVRGTGPLADCVRDVLDHAKLPPSPAGLEGAVFAPLFFATHSALRDTEEQQPGTALLGHRGLSVTYVARVGDVDSQGIGLQGQVDVSGDREIRQVLAGEIEAGASSSGSMYAARAYFGLGIAISPRMALTLAGGIGTSQFTGQLSRGLEVPFEARLRVVRGRSRFQAWVRPVRLFGASDRMSEGDSVMFGADEYNVGAGVSTVVQGRRLLIGASYENRVLGKSGMFTVGVPFGVY